MADLNGNPIAPGNTINVIVEGNVLASVDLNINMPDTQSRKFTQFSFTIQNADPDINVAKPVTIKIEVNGPNGYNSLKISRTAY